VCDLRDPGSLERMVEAIRDRFGGVDILINNGADLTSKPFLETSLEAIDDLMRTNVTGLLQLTRLVAPMMAERGSGLIVNVSSLAGSKPNVTQTVYSISKTGVNGASEALGADLRRYGIHVMNVHLPSVSAEEPTPAGQVPAAVYARKLERAMARRMPELYLSVVTKWLMRLYKFYPPLARIR